MNGIKETTRRAERYFSRRVVSRLFELPAGGEVQGGDRLTERDKQMVTLAQTEGWAPALTSAGKTAAS